MPFARWRLTLIALGALGLAVGISILDASPVGVAADDSMYVILAKSLATGQGYRFLNLPGAPAATHFPPGYPALLALLWRIAPHFPENLLLFKSANAVFLAVVVVAVARLARLRTGSAAWAAGIGAITAVSVPLLVLGNMILSEMFFLALLLLLLPALEEFVDRPTPPAHALPGRAALLGASIGLCMLVRTHAIVLVPAVAVLLLVRRRRRDAAILSAVAVCCLLPWQIWSARHGGVLSVPLLGEYDSYTGWWLRGYRALGPQMIPRTLRRTGEETLTMWAMLFSPARSGGAHAVTLIALAAIGLAGIRAQWHRIPVTLLFLAGYLLIVAVWPFPPSRFVWGMWPLFLMVLAEGARSMATSVKLAVTDSPPRAFSTNGSRAMVAAGAIAVLWIAFGYASYEVRAVRGQWWASIARANSRRIVPEVQWTLANTTPGDVVAAEDDGAVYLYTGRRTVPVRTFTVEQYLTTITPQMDAEQGLLPLAAVYPVRAVVVGSSATFAAAQWLAAQPVPLIALHDEFPGGAAFTVLRR